MAMIYRKGIFGTGGPARVRLVSMRHVPRVPEYIYIEDLSDYLYTEAGDPLIIE